ncbi:MAG: hypothetical protein IJ192_12910, partial [Clostridia bacterium]|nr:hypothetical protein [Clostridia bacterium]
VLGAIIAVVPFGTKAADNSKTISITETIIIDGKELNINAFVKYDLKGNNQQSSENSENNNNSIEKDIIKGSLSKTLDCIINNEFNSDFHYLSMYGDIKEQLIENEIPSSLAKNVSYEIGNIEITQDDQSDTYAVIDVTFNSVDMIRLLSNIDNEETYRSLIIDKLNNKDYVEKVFDVKLIMIKIEDLWHLYETEQLDDVFMGGLYSLDMDLQDEYFKELNGGNENG